jgi:NAD(P)-dependent dehydrogenase (short-subunit alcohol dehydrogenase family)
VRNHGGVSLRSDWHMNDGPVTLVTGGSRGIGAATVRRLLREGHRIAITGRNGDRLNRFVEELNRPPGLVRAFVADASSFDMIDSAVASTVKDFGRLDNVIANAGFGTRGDITDGDPGEWQAMILTNVLGPALLIKSALPALKETHGRIILIGSVAGFVYTVGNLYGAAKWAMTGLAENTRRMVTADGIGVTLVAPGPVETNFYDHVGGNPYPHSLTAEQVADVIAWTINQPPGVDVNTVIVRPIGFEL